MTHNAAFLTWEPGFDYGYEQLFHIQLWRVEKNAFGHSDAPQLSSLPSRTFVNVTTSYFLVSNLEPNTYYRVALWAQNQAGKSTGSAQIAIQTTSSQSYLLKPVYASADEQKLNGLIGNKIMVEDLLELLVFMCLVLLVVLSIVTSVGLYCRRKRSQQQQLSSLSDSNKSVDTQNDCSAKLMDHSPIGCRYTLVDGTQTPTVSSTPSNIANAAGMCSSDNCNTNSLSTTSSYVIKDDYIPPPPPQPVTSVAHCRPINLTTAANVGGIGTSVEDFASLDSVENHHHHHHHHHHQQHHNPQLHHNHGKCKKRIK